MYILGIAVTGASDINTDLVSSNQITDYSFVTQPFTLDRSLVILRCVTGLGSSGSGKILHWVDGTLMELKYILEEIVVVLCLKYVYVEQMVGGIQE